MWEIIVFGIAFYLIFHDLLDAKAEEIRERTRGIDIENEMMEIQLAREYGEQGEEHVTNENGADSVTKEVC